MTAEAAARHNAARLGAAACVAAALWLGVASCREGTVMHFYRETPVEGWDQSDALVYPIDTVKDGGVYKMEVGVRTTNGYPYQKLWLTISAELHNPDTAFADTLACGFVDAGGARDGSGTDTYQYRYDAGTVELRKGQSGTFRIQHIMRREILPGISDIGIRLSR